jgi:hypothetical protein
VAKTEVTRSDDPGRHYELFLTYQFCTKNQSLEVYLNQQVAQLKSIPIV